ncbi:hypothetical protein OUZ56_029695 [Daphnia magna]|uniref:Uncharacterized protein n=1 Tax=Daphnia magna TaxID=35525 RepID=A0ABR0B7K0_9CRUS|nr:hypothetical protein OUZ56_029695 [Daphnia magna]
MPKNRPLLLKVSQVRVNQTVVKDFIAEVVDSDMNHSNREPDSGSDEETYVDCEEESETFYEMEEDETFFYCEEHSINTVSINVSFEKVLPHRT